METYSETLITPSKIKLMIPSGISLGMGDDFFISRLQERPQYKYLRYPFRADCFMAAYCVEGSVDCSVNLNEYHLTSGTPLRYGGHVHAWPARTQYLASCLTCTDVHR